LLFLITCLIPSNIPFFVAICAAILGCIFAGVRLFKPEWTSIALKLAIYIQAPLLIYQCEIDTAPWATHLLRHYNVLFALLAFGAVLVLKFTKRKTGFKSTPMDFLIIFIALIIPNIPDAQIRSYQIGLIAAKIISIYYGYEVLIGELREDYKRLSFATTLTLLLICSRGFLGV
jgi:UDP-GlcNAc:undecaprenyl-phosphate/decaprenyl-phosphate GlcNAc-1-phosphate transferase